MGLAFPAVLFAMLLTQPPPSASADTPLSPSDSSPLRATLLLNKDAYEVGEPIAATVRLVNVSSEPVEVLVNSEATGRDHGFSFEVRTSTGRILKDPHIQSVSSSLMSIVLIEAGTTYRRELLLNHFVPVLEPGTYSVTAAFQAMRPLGRGPAARSTAVPFQVLATPDAALAARVAALVRRLKGGDRVVTVARLLGFTGHSGAIPPLVTLLRAPEDTIAAAAAEALLYLDHARVKAAVLQSLRSDEPRDRLVHLLVARLQANRDEVTPVLLPWLSSPAEISRAAALEGLHLSNFKDKDPGLFNRFVKLLDDPSPRVRQRAAYAVGAYADAPAFRSLKPAVDDPDPTVSTQATIAMGWIAHASEAGTPLRKEAIAVLRSMAQSGGRAAEQAAYWLAQIKNE